MINSALGRRILNGAFCSSVLALAGCSHRALETPTKLGPVVQLDGYTVQPPAGLTLTTRHKQIDCGNMTSYTWQGAKRASGDHVVFHIIIFHRAPVCQSQAPSVGMLIAEESAQLGKNRTQFNGSMPPPIDVNGTTFTRFAWQAFSTTRHIEEHGFIYEYANSEKIVAVDALDSEPDNLTTLPLCESAAMTLHQK